MTSLTYPQLPESCLVVLIGVSGAGKSTLAGTWPASQVLSLDALREAVSDDFSVKSSVLSVCVPRDGAAITPGGPRLPSISSELPPTSNSQVIGAGVGR